MASLPVELSAMKQPQREEADAYARLLTDAMRGEAMLFVRADAVEGAWAIVDPILGTETPITDYECGAWGPPEAEQLTESIGGWQAPVTS